MHASKPFVELSQNSPENKAILPIELREDHQSFINILFPNFKLSSCTFLICLLQLFFYFLTSIFYYNGYKTWECTLYTFGAGYEPSIKHDFALHRLFINPFFLNYDLKHLVIYVLWMCIFCFYLEKMFARKIHLFIALFFAIGLGGSILTNMVYWQFLKVDPSSAILGCFVVYLRVLIKERNDIIYKSKTRFILLFLIFNIFAFPIIRLYEKRETWGRKNMKKVNLGLGLFIFLYLIMLLDGILNMNSNSGRNTNKNEDDEVFRWRILNNIGRSEESGEGQFSIDYISYLGKENEKLL